LLGGILGGGGSSSPGEEGGGGRRWKAGPGKTAKSPTQTFSRLPTPRYTICRPFSYTFVFKYVAVIVAGGPTFVVFGICLQISVVQGETGLPVSRPRPRSLEVHLVTSYSSSVSYSCYLEYM
jgi:hypothetical protein